MVFMSSWVQDQKTGSLWTFYFNIKNHDLPDIVQYFKNKGYTYAEDDAVLRFEKGRTLIKSNFESHEWIGVATISEKLRNIFQWIAVITMLFIIILIFGAIFYVVGFGVQFLIYSINPNIANMFSDWLSSFLNIFIIFILITGILFVVFLIVDHIEMNMRSVAIRDILELAKAWNIKYETSQYPSKEIADKFSILNITFGDMQQEETAQTDNVD